MIDLYMPQTPGEWLPAACATITFLFGFVFFAAPRTALTLVQMRPEEDEPELLSLARSRIAGAYMGLGATSLLLQQPLVYLALGACWGLTAFGRMISIVSDDGNTLYNWAMLLLELALALSALVPLFI